MKVLGLFFYDIGNSSGISYIIKNSGDAHAAIRYITAFAASRRRQSGQAFHERGDGELKWACSLF